MTETPYLIVNARGIVMNASECACTLCGISLKTLLDSPILDHIITDHRARFEGELAAIVNLEEAHGRVHCTILGLDEIGRRMNMALTRHDDGNVIIDLSATAQAVTSEPTRSTLADPLRLLPVTRRVAAICRQAIDKESLLTDTLTVLAESTNADSAAAIEWGGGVAGWPVIATFENFDQTLLHGVFRSSVIGRLTRGDVIVKEACADGTTSDASLILVPLMASETPEGIAVLNVKGYSVLIPQEQQGLSMLGEVIGLGIRALATIDSPGTDYHPRAADNDATIALGRLSAGLAHEINNAATVLRNNIEQISADARRFARNSAIDQATKDSIAAVETIRGLTDALRAFAPEETRNVEKVDLLRVVDMVISAVRFYAKRGIDVSVFRPESNQLAVECRSHYLIRALFMLFVELVESALASSRELIVDITLTPGEKTVSLAIIVSAGPFNVTTILLSQLEHGGVLARHVIRAGATLSYEVQPDRLFITIELPTIAPVIRKSDPPPGRSSQFPTRRGTILIVDDEPAIIRSTRRLLEQNHDVLAAKSGPEAIEIMKANPQIDVVLLDVFMPGMTGLDICEHLKRQNSVMTDRLVFITGGATDQDVAKYLVQSNCPVLEKPIDIPSLNRMIAEMISN